jgi:hypothetical protein
MDPTTLVVPEQIADGKRLLERLEQAGFPVAAAAWLRESVRGYWQLYVVSPVVEDQGRRNAYGWIHRVAREIPQPFLIAPLDVRARSPHEPLGEALIALAGRYAGMSSPIYHGETRLGETEIDGAYIYPAAALAEKTNGQVSGTKSP